MGITLATTGGVAAAATINQYGDVPNTVPTASAATAQALASATYATLPTTPVATSIVTTHASTLVAVTVSAQFGVAALAAPTANAFVSFALSGSVTLAASDLNAVAGSSPGNPVSGGSFVYWVVVPAGTLTATVQARWITATGVRVSNVQIQIVAIRPV